MGKNKLKIILSFGVSLLLIVVLVFQLNWHELGIAFSQIKALALIPALAVLAVHYAFRALRWKSLLPDDDQGTFRQRLDSIMVGNLASFILPLRAGEFIRPLLYSRYSGTPFAVGFSSVILERVFDLLAVLLTFGLLVILVNNFPPEVFIGASALATFGALLLAFFVMAAVFEEQLEKLAAFCLRFLPQKIRGIAQKIINDLLKAALVLRSPKKLIAITTLTVCVWGAGYLSFLTFFWLFGLYPSFLVAVTVSVVVALAVAAPSAPGFLGVYQWAWIAGMSLFGMNKEMAVAISLVSHALNYALFFGYGGYVLLRDGIALKDLASTDRSSADTVKNS